MISQDDKLATLSIVASELEAQLLVNILNENGIAAVATGGFISAFRAEAPGEVRVLVKDDDLADARSVLAKRHQAAVAAAANESAESSSYESRLTRFGIWSLLVLELISILESLVYWAAGETPTAMLFVALAISVAIILAIVQRLRSSSN